MFLIARTHQPLREERGEQKHKLRVNEVLEGRGRVLITYLKVNRLLSERNRVSLSANVTSSLALISNIVFSSQGRRSALLFA